MMLTVDKLVRQGWSIEAIYAEHGGEMPVGVRTCYTYVDKGFAGVSSIDLPRKVRYKPRKKRKEPGRDRVDRTPHLRRLQGAAARRAGPRRAGRLRRRLRATRTRGRRGRGDARSTWRLRSCRASSWATWA